MQFLVLNQVFNLPKMSLTKIILLNLFHKLQVFSLLLQYCFETSNTEQKPKTTASCWQSSQQAANFFDYKLFIMVIILSFISQRSRLVYNSIFLKTLTFSFLSNNILFKNDSFYAKNNFIHWYKTNSESTSIHDKCSQHYNKIQITKEIRMMTIYFHDNETS